MVSDRFPCTGPALLLGVASGRRRQGKILLLNALSGNVSGFLFSATQATEAERLRLLGEAFHTPRTTACRR